MKFSPTTVFQDVASFFPMLWAIARGRWKMPWNTLFWAVLCGVYLLSPIDVLPDVMPIIGITDDGAFILLVLTLLHKDLSAFRAARAETKKVLEAQVLPPAPADKK